MNLLALFLASAFSAEASGVQPVLQGWVQQDGDLVTIIAPDRVEAFEIKNAIEPALHLEWDLPRRYVYMIAKTKPSWTTQQLLDHLDYALRRDDGAVGTVVFENVRFEPTPELRARLKALRARGRIVLFMRYGLDGAPAS